MRGLNILFGFIYLASGSLMGVVESQVGIMKQKISTTFQAFSKTEFSEIAEKQLDEKWVSLDNVLLEFKEFLNNNYGSYNLGVRVGQSLLDLNKDLKNRVNSLINARNKNDDSDIFIYEQLVKTLNSKIASIKSFIDLNLQNLHFAKQLCELVLEKVQDILVKITKQLQPESLKIFAPEPQGLNIPKMAEEIEKAYQKVFGSGEILKQEKKSLKVDSGGKYGELVEKLKPTQIEQLKVSEDFNLQKIATIWNPVVERFNKLLSFNQSSSDTLDRVALITNKLNLYVNDSIRKLETQKPKRISQEGEIYHLDIFYDSYVQTIKEFSKHLDELKKAAAQVTSKSDLSYKNIINKMFLAFESILNKIKQNYGRYFFNELNLDILKIEENLKLQQALILEASLKDLNSKDTKKRIQNWNNNLVYLKAFVDNSTSKELPPLLKEIIEFNNKVFNDFATKLFALKDNPDQLSSNINSLTEQYIKELNVIRAKVASVRTWFAGPRDAKAAIQILVGIPSSGNTLLKPGILDKIIGKIYSGFKRVFEEDTFKEIDNVIRKILKSKINLVNDNNDNIEKIFKEWNQLLLKTSESIKSLNNKNLNCFFVDYKSRCKNIDGKILPTIFELNFDIAKDLENLKTVAKEQLNSKLREYLGKAFDKISLIGKSANSLISIPTIQESDDVKFQRQQLKDKIRVILYLLGKFDLLLKKVATDFSNDPFFYENFYKVYKKYERAK